VKGKGMMTTFYVHPKGITESQLISPVRMPAGIPLAQTPNLQRQTSHHGSFSAVVLIVYFEIQIFCCILLETFKYV